jgi:PAS domain S-box-containing protein
MSGFGVEELTGKFFAEITYPDDLQGSAAALQRLWRGEVPSYAIEKRYVRKDSSILWARVTVAPLHSPEGKLEGAVGILEDITERKAAEAEVGRVHQQLLLASRQAGMADVATNVLHNVGNVLNSLNLSANVLAENLQRSKVDALARCTKLLGDHSAQLASFLLEDERGRHLPEFLTQLSNHMQANQRASLTFCKNPSTNGGNPCRLCRRFRSLFAGHSD